MELKLPLVKNKRNQQLNFTIPKRKFSKEFVKDIQNKKYIKIDFKMKGGKR